MQIASGICIHMILYLYFVKKVYHLSQRPLYDFHIHDALYIQANHSYEAKLFLPANVPGKSNYLDVNTSKQKYLIQSCTINIYLQCQDYKEMWQLLLKSILPKLCFYCTHLKCQCWWENMDTVCSQKFNTKNLLSCQVVGRQWKWHMRNTAMALYNHNNQNPKTPKLKNINIK